MGGPRPRGVGAGGGGQAKEKGPEFGAAASKITWHSLCRREAIGKASPYPCHPLPPLRRAPNSGGRGERTRTIWGGARGANQGLADAARGRRRWRPAGPGVVGGEPHLPPGKRGLRTGKARPPAAEAGDARHPVPRGPSTAVVREDAGRDAGSVTARGGRARPASWARRAAGHPADRCSPRARRGARRLGSHLAAAR
jgi:hypothetical protein